MKSYTICLIAAFLVRLATPGSAAEIVALGESNDNEGTPSCVHCQSIPSPSQTPMVRRPTLEWDGARGGHASSQRWPFAIEVQHQPGTYWWCPGSAWDKESIDWNLENLREGGIGTVHIVPVSYTHLTLPTN